MSLLPRPPWPFSHRKISHSPEQTPPKDGGSPQSHAFFHPSFSNHAKLSRILETFRIGFSRFAIIIAILPRTLGEVADRHDRGSTGGMMRLPAASVSEKAFC